MKPNADELHAARCGDYWGALRSMYRRTGQGWDACIAALLAAGRCSMIGWGGGPEDLRTFQRRSDLIAAAAAVVWVLVWAVTR